MMACLYGLAGEGFTGQEMFKGFQIRFVGQWDNHMSSQGHNQRLIKNKVQKTRVVNKMFVAPERVMNWGCLRYSGYRSTGH